MDQDGEDAPQRKRDLVDYEYTLSLCILFDLMKDGQIKLSGGITDILNE